MLLPIKLLTRERIGLLLGLTLAGSPFSAARADHPTAGFGSGVAGPIITIPAHVLPDGKWAASFRLEWIDFQAFSDSALVRLAENGIEAHSTDNVSSPSLSVAYGLSRTFTVSARLPYVARSDIREGHLEGTIGEVHNHGRSEGIGDVTLLGEILVLEKNRSKISLLTGLKAPTGQTHIESDGERFETEHQPGSGSWDFLEGIAWSRELSFGSFDANLLTAFATDGAQETNLGTFLIYNAAISGKLAGGVEHPHSHGHRPARPHHHASTVGADVILELNGEVRARQKIAGAEEPNSGGNLIYLSPGIRFGPDAWSASVSMGFPVLQDLNGTQHKTDWRILLGFGIAF